MKYVYFMMHRLERSAELATWLLLLFVVLSLFGHQLILYIAIRTFYLYIFFFCLLLLAIAMIGQEIRNFFVDSVPSVWCVSVFFFSLTQLCKF